MQKRLTGVVLLGALALSACQDSVSPPVSTDSPGAAFVKAPTGSAHTLGKMEAINKQLKKKKLSIAVEAIEFFTIGAGRPTNRIHQQPFRWVPNDERRLADGENITYLVDQSDGATASGLTSAQTEAALDRALHTWDISDPFKNVSIIKRPDTGADPDIFDSFFNNAPGGPFGGAGNTFLADIVEAGWLPRAFFEAVGGPGGGDGILAFSVTFIFTDDVTGAPTDINGDNYLDTALNEVYYNNTFGQPGTFRANRPWGIDAPPPGIDVETVGLHENGHSLELGHFGPPPDAVMNPVYAGIRQLPLSSDLAGMHAVWSSWPNP